GSGAADRKRLRLHRLRPLGSIRPGGPRPGDIPPAVALAPAAGNRDVDRRQLGELGGTIRGPLPHGDGEPLRIAGVFRRRHRPKQLVNGAPRAPEKAAGLIEVNIWALFLMS